MQLGSFRAQQYQQDNGRKRYQSPNVAQPQQQQGGLMDNFMQGYQIASGDSPYMKFGKNMRKLYDDSAARRADGMYKGTKIDRANIPEQFKGMSDKEIYNYNPEQGATFQQQQIMNNGGPTLEDFGISNASPNTLNQTGTQMLQQGNTAVGNNMANFATNSSNLANAAIGGTTDAAISVGTPSISILGANAPSLAANSVLDATTGTLAGGNAIGTGIIGAETAGAGGTSAAGAAVAPWLLPAAAGVFGLGSLLGWFK